MTNPTAPARAPDEALRSEATGGRSAGTRVTQATNEILEAFRTGRLAEPLAQTFLHHGLHCEKWSFTNQMLVHLFGFGDAATYKQWQALGRQVKRGSTAFYLMRPNLKLARVLDEETGEERTVQAGLRGFGWFAVHGLEDTVPIPGFQGQPYDAAVATGRAFVATLPLLDVAKAWGLTVATYHGSEGRGLGYARPGQQIGLGVANLSTWAHELVHQAEHRLGALTKRGQDREQEIVAELGGAVLLTVLGQRAEADWGGAYHYIKSYAKAKDGEGLLREVMHVTGRMAAAVKHILDEAEALRGEQPAVS
jgi:hypothetical protein